MEIKPSQFERFVASPPEGLNAVLVYGPDRGVVRERANAMTRSVVPDLADPFRITELEEERVASDPACLWDEAAALSMMGGRRVVRIRDAGNGLTSVMSRFLEEPAGDALIVVEAGDLAKSASLRQLFGRADNAAAIPCYADDARTIESLIRTSLRADGLSVDPDALALLVSRLGSDRGVTRAELEKLVLYAMGDEMVTVAHVDAVLGDESALRIEEIADSAGLGDYVRLDRTLGRVWEAGTSAGSVLRRTMMHFHQLLLVRSESDQRSDPGEAMRKLRPPVHFSRKVDFLAQIRRWNTDRIMHALKYLYEAEGLTRTTGVPEQAACGRALFNVAALAQGERR